MLLLYQLVFPSIRFKELYILSTICFTIQTSKSFFGNNKTLLAYISYETNLFRYFFKIVSLDIHIWYLNPNHTNISESLIIKNHIKGLYGHKSCPRKGPWPAIVLHWALQGPRKGPCRIFRFVKALLTFFKNALSKPSEHHGTRLWSLLYFTKLQVTSWTFMDP